MKVLVCAKRVVDPYVRVRFRSSGELDVADLKHGINPFDEVAVEEAVRLKEKGLATEVIAVAMGPEDAEESLRAALAIGADRGVLVVTGTPPEPLIVARVLAHLVERESCGLVLLGKQAIDGDSGQVGPMLAGLRGWPQATAAAAIEVEGSRLTVVCEGDDGAVTVRCSMPAVVSVDLRLNTPRYASLQGIMRAKKKPIEKMPLEQLSIDRRTSSFVRRVYEPPRREAKCVMVDSVDELVDALRRTEKVI